ncbi:hypothetical protein T03_11114 [Trichinella britovi]|uniref:Uncharacterized protein n=1 Tax=Trichinella britovi TaxID=45882 RepID=A0A0V1D3S2_TRIBR|nr:hypothetical protein T03_11114 [Trichinella britovi]
MALDCPLICNLSVDVTFRKLSGRLFQSIKSAIILLNHPTAPHLCISLALVIVLLLRLRPTSINAIHNPQLKHEVIISRQTSVIAVLVTFSQNLLTVLNLTSIHLWKVQTYEDLFWLPHCILLSNYVPYWAGP